MSTAPDFTLDGLPAPEHSAIPRRVPRDFQVARRMKRDLSAAVVEILEAIREIDVENKPAVSKRLARLGELHSAAVAELQEW